MTAVRRSRAESVDQVRGFLRTYPGALIREIGEGCGRDPYGTFSRLLRELVEDGEVVRVRVASKGRPGLRHYLKADAPAGADLVAGEEATFGRWSPEQQRIAMRLRDGDHLPGARKVMESLFSRAVNGSPYPAWFFVAAARG